MKRMACGRTAAWLALATGIGLFAQATRVAKPPAVYVDKGACPFECCQYGEWTARQPAPAYAEPVENAPPVATVTTGTKILAVTGEVRTKAGRFTVTQEHPSMRSMGGEPKPYKPGDVLYVYTYHGEGAFTVWFAGEMYEEMMEFSPYGGGPGDGFWGELDGDLETVWWVKAQLPDGRVVWLRNPANFNGMDACG
jgi:hypothetical protein